MKTSAAIFFMGIASSSLAFAAPKIACVRVADVYKSLDKTREQQSDVEAQKADLLKDRRVTELQKMATDLQTQYGSLPQPVDDASRAKVREYALKYREAQTLQEDFASFRDEETKHINAQKVKDMREALAFIVETARKIGKEQGFDWVLDTSGNTNTTTPLILYAKAPVDITGQVLTAIQPGATEAAAAAKATKDTQR